MDRMAHNKLTNASATSLILPLPSHSEKPLQFLPEKPIFLHILRYITINLPPTTPLTPVNSSLIPSHRSLSPSYTAALGSAVNGHLHYLPEARHLSRSRSRFSFRIRSTFPTAMKNEKQEMAVLVLRWSSAARSTSSARHGPWSMLLATSRIQKPTTKMMTASFSLILDDEAFVGVLYGRFDPLDAEIREMQGKGYGGKSSSSAPLSQQDL